MYIIAHIAVVGGSKVSVKVKPNAFYMGVLFCLSFIFFFPMFCRSFLSCLSILCSIHRSYLIFNEANVAEMEFI